MTFKLAGIFVLCLLWTTISFGQNSIEKFRYQPNKVPVGTVLHYVKTNLNGSHPENIVLYIAAPDRLESFKYKSPGTRSALVKATMDWDLYCAKYLESWQMFPDGKQLLLAVLKYSPTEKTVEADIKPLNRTPDKVTIQTLPFHMYNFDLSSLNVTFAHLIDPKGSFTIGLIDPTFQDEGPVIRYRGDVDVSFVKIERHNRATCLKYRIDGPGLDHKGGFIWVNQARGYVEDMELATPDNPEWKSFKFRLRQSRQMTPTAWEAFIKKQLGVK